jgi:hypothetical protein
LQRLRAEGKNDSSCREYATGIRTTIEDDIRALQATLDAANNGTACRSEGQIEVDTMREKNNSAAELLANELANNSAANNVEVTWRHYVDEVSPTDNAAVATLIRSNPDYVAARSAIAETENAVHSAQGAASMANQALIAAQDAQQVAITECQCRARYTHDREFAAATENQANVTAEWAKAAYIICTLDGTPHTDCVVPAAPSVTRPPLPDDVQNVAGCDTQPM